MNAFEKSVSLGLTGTVAEKVTVLRTLTSGDIPTASVRTWFREKELWLERSTGGMFGPLQTAYESAEQSQKDGLDYLYDTVFARSAEYLRTTNPVWSVKVWQLVQLVISLSPQVSGLVESFYDLDGGRPYATLTVEEYDAQATAAAAAAEKTALVEYLAALKQSFDAKYNVALSDIALGSITTNEQLIAAVQVGV